MGQKGGSFEFSLRLPRRNDRTRQGAPPIYAAVAATLLGDRVH
jgi:hypothetical protein